MLLFSIWTSAGSDQTFVLESRSSAVAIIIPGLTSEIRRFNYFSTLLFGLNCCIYCVFVSAVPFSTRISRAY